MSDTLQLVVEVRLSQLLSGMQELPWKTLDSQLKSQRINDLFLNSAIVERSELSCETALIQRSYLVTQRD